jgi:hypothetical protein
MHEEFGFCLKYEDPDLYLKHEETDMSMKYEVVLF